MSDGVHPYFLWKAREAFRKAGGSHALSGPLAAWAETARAAGDPDVGVIVGASGEILAETRYVRSGYTGATYVVRSPHPDVRDLEAGIAVSRLTVKTGHGCAVIRYSQACEGPVPVSARRQVAAARELVNRVGRASTGSGEVIRLSDLSHLGPVEDARNGHLANQAGYFVLPTTGWEEVNQILLVLDALER